MTATPNCQTCRDTGMVAATPGQPGDGPAECPDCGPPDMPALEAWHEAHPYDRGSDSPTTRLWFPHEPPSVLLDTYTADHWHGPDRLRDPKRPTCHVRLGSTIQVGGYLADMEAYFAAVLDALRYARWQADCIAAEMAAESEEAAR